MTPRLTEFTLGGILTLVLATLRDPRGTGRQILSMQLPVPVLWLLLVTIAVWTALLGQTAAVLLLPGDAAEGGFTIGPLGVAAMQVGGLLATVLAVHHLGRLMGGQGTLERSLLLMSWLEVVMLCVQIVQLAVLLVFSVLGAATPGLFVVVASFALMMWVFTAFVAEIHGFHNLWLVFLMIIVSVLAISFVLSLVLSMLGLTFTGGGFA
ncbi:YIP1 family protein [Mangrovicoccus algicola]|uniref:YIP1 family protein n=1 Tax=Mangrovicoccus algicola TaxID=2771008 RepID=A0A8J6Z769_9RHOB|nr:YIP1 family protein [Mangrovicoccus algicola]MBE3637730.1 YIP1 family protein [Mangrovicoccus algicola]